MQFAGQRTTMDLEPIGEPVNFLITLNDDTLPSPDALMVTGIAPQQTVDEGYTEAEAVKLLIETVFTPDTIAVGFNNIRFDDEFIRYLFWRNFYDPYEWSWSDGRSRWDLLDVVRMTRALRPDGIEWPVDRDGKPTNRLELLSSINGITHENAHDALSDVQALIDVTRLIRDRQPQLYEYLLDMRDKANVKALVNLDDKQPFVYVSGRYDAQWHKATVAFPLTSAPNGNVVVYDLRHDPTPFLDLSVEELEKRLFADYETRKNDGFVPVPAKPLQYNRVPAVAPLGVLSQHDGWQRIGLDEATIQRHLTMIVTNPDFAERLRSVYEKRTYEPTSRDPEGKLYDGFLADGDRLRVEAVRNAGANDLADFHPEFVDERLPSLLLHYKARSFPKSLSADERAAWEEWRTGHLERQIPGFMKSLERVAKARTDEASQYMVEELRLWFEAIAPSDE